MYSICIYTKPRTLRKGGTLVKEKFTSSKISKFMGVSF